MSDRPVKLVLVDDDSLWRLGLRTALREANNLQDSSQGSLEIIAETEQLEELLDLELTTTPDVLLLGVATPYLDQLWQPCLQIQQKFPNLSILLLSVPLTTEELAQARARGIKGYCLRTEAIATIIAVVHQIAGEESFWSDRYLTKEIKAKEIKEISAPPANTTFLYRQATTGVNQINRELETILTYLERSQLSNISWFFWSGRKRELLAARWLINQLLPISLVNSSSDISSDLSTSISLRKSLSTNSPRESKDTYATDDLTSILLVESDHQSLVANSIIKKIYDRIQIPLETELFNLTGNTLEIDILASKKRRDLLSLILNEFITLCEDLSLSQVDQEYIKTNNQQLLQDLWATTITKFFGKYSSLKVGVEEQEIVATLLLNRVIIQEEILEKIPFVEELLSQILFTANLTIDDTSYLGESGEAIARAGLILENLIIQVANAVVQPLLNQFSEVETIKLAFYDQKLISARDITKFRNDLSWKYRLNNYFHEPKLMFESSYQLYIFSEAGLRTTKVYAPRTQELEALTGLRYFFTLWLELKDAIAPRFGTLTRLLGRGFVYLLTQIVGRGIGLVGKGILQGIGNSFQEVRAGKGDRK